MESLDTKSVINFLKFAYDLKEIRRKGWELRDIPNPESIADHMYAMALITFLIGNNSGLDRLKCMQLALIHDLPECIVGDIVPDDPITVEEKHKLEQNAIEKLTNMLGSDTDAGKIIYDTYIEYREQKTPEAKFVKDLDKFDMIFTAALYEKRCGSPKRLQEFFDCTEGKFGDPFIQNLVKSLHDYRENMFK
ncbi:hypothetical protein MML48_2g00018929 [Holotrichia oblita]|uniref:Uncharacterized protein n=1 Tax=Holotrichia oblita TaxID=644536 RepID=A0ACB9TJB2_HOLOL|nr:hypothetical protein MML48_2g00018929 [Holotrichia oblita]